jgi:hypothetical protein
MSHQTCAAICLTPAAGQAEFLASQYPDGSIAFSVMQKDKWMLYLLVPPRGSDASEEREPSGRKRKLIVG